MYVKSILHITIKARFLPAQLSANMSKLGLRIGQATIFTVLAAANAQAQVAGGTDPTTILTNIANFITGPFGQSLAILGIVAIGLSWMFGRASLGLIAGVVGGIVLMFGAAFLAKQIAPAGG